MRLIAAFLLFYAFLISCSKKEMDQRPVPQPPTRPLPSVPKLNDFTILMKDTGITTASMEWTSATDEHHDSVSYSIFLDDIQAASNLRGERKYNFANLSQDHSYIVKIKAVNSRNDSIVKTRSFRTKDSYYKFFRMIAPDLAPQDMVLTSNNEYVLSTFGSNTKLFIVHINTSGKLIWSKPFNYDGRDSRIKKTNGGYLVSGYNYIIKIDSVGNLIWERSMPPTGVYFHSFTEAENGEIYVAASEDRSGGLQRTAIYKMNATGNILWKRNYKMSDFGLDRATNIIPTGTGSGFFVLGEFATGGTSSSQVFTDVWLFEIDNNGNVLWEKTYGDEKYDFAKNIIINNDNILIGYSTVEWGQSKTMKILRLERNGNQLKQFSIKEAGFYDMLLDIEPTSDGGYVISGNYTIGISYNIASVYKFDTNDNKQWEKTYAIVNTDWNMPGPIVQVADGGFVFPIIRIDNKLIGVSSRDLWLIKTNTTGNYK